MSHEADENLVELIFLRGKSEFLFAEGTNGKRRFEII